VAVSDVPAQLPDVVALDPHRPLRGGQLPAEVLHVFLQLVDHLLARVGPVLTGRHAGGEERGGDHTQGGQGGG
jgi:hypothetical protein